MDQKEFEHIAKDLRRRCIEVAHRYSLDGDEAEDVAQETMIRLWTMRDSIDDSSSPQALASAIARNMSISFLRRRHTVPIDSLRMTDERTAQPDTALETEENDRWLKERLEALPSTEHQVLKMRQVERKTNAEIASLLGIGEASVSTLLARARRRLLEEIRERNRR